MKRKLLFKSVGALRINYEENAAAYHLSEPWVITIFTNPDEYIKGTEFSISGEIITLLTNEEEIKIHDTDVYMILLEETPRNQRELSGEDIDQLILDYLSSNNPKLLHLTLSDLRYAVPKIRAKYDTLTDHSKSLSNTLAQVDKNLEKAKAELVKMEKAFRERETEWAEMRGDEELLKNHYQELYQKLYLETYKELYS